MLENAQKMTMTQKCYRRRDWPVSEPICLSASSKQAQHVKAGLNVQVWAMSIEPFQRYSFLNVTVSKCLEMFKNDILS